MQTERDRLVSEAQNLRDYLLRAGTDTPIELIEALMPFDASETSDPPDPSQVTRLYVAFETAHRRASELVDPYTLNAVMKGRSPFRRPTTLQRVGSVVGSLSLTALGLVLVLLAFHFSYWANRATFMLSEAERFRSFDHFQQVMKLVELESYFDDLPLNNPPGDIEPHLLYLEGISSLSEHYWDEISIPTRMRQLIEDVNPANGTLQRVQRRICPDYNEPPAQGLRRLLCPALPPGAVAQSGGGQAGGPVPAPGLAVAEEASSTPFRVGVEQIERLRERTMEAAGRDPNYAASYERSQSVMLNWSEELRSLLSIVHRWGLPIIYGALGSVVYCMWRVLNPATVPLGFLYTILRTAFAGLAALTLSMLFIPSNALVLGSQPSQPLIYLFAFIFGYSIEAFVNTLNNLNAYLASSLAPRKRKEEDAGAARS